MLPILDMLKSWLKSGDGSVAGWLGDFYGEQDQLLKFFQQYMKTVTMKTGMTI